MEWKLLSIILLITYCKKTGVNLAYTALHKQLLIRLTTGLFHCQQLTKRLLFYIAWSWFWPQPSAKLFFFFKYFKWRTKHLQSSSCYCLSKSQKCGKWQQKYYLLPLFTEQLCKSKTLILNLLWVTEPLENLTKARKTCIHKICSSLLQSSESFKSQLKVKDFSASLWTPWDSDCVLLPTSSS